VLASVLAVSASKPAHAVPSFAAQTGQACQMCHIGALGPQLTPYGRNFKMKGYTLTGGTGLASQVHLALWVQSGFTYTDKALPQDAAPHYNTNDNAGVQAISLFYSGRISDNVGVFLQATYDNVAKALAQDNSDVRIIGDGEIFGKDVDYGVSIDNAPGWSDPYNSNYLWGYPYITSFLAVGPNAAPVLAGAEQDNSIGVVGYAWYDQHIYVDLGGYETQAPGIMRRLGEAYGAGSATGIEPYTSATYAWFWATTMRISAAPSSTAATTRPRQARNAAPPTAASATTSTTTSCCTAASSISATTTSTSIRLTAGTITKSSI